MSIWPNRIVKYGVVTLEDVLANEGNWRIHPAAQQAALEGALDVVGIVKPLLLNLRTGEEWPIGERGVETLIDGHGRIVLGMRRGQTTWPAVWVDLTPKEEKLVLATLDPITALAVPDPAKWAELRVDLDPPEALVPVLDGVLAVPPPERQELDLPPLDVGEGLAREEGGSVGAVPNRYPLAIVLAKQDYARWLRYKEQAKKRSDQDAFLALLQEVGA